MHREKSLKSDKELSIACVAGAWKSQEKTGAREGDTRVSLASARSLFRPLLPSACYAG